MLRKRLRYRPGLRAFTAFITLIVASNMLLAQVPAVDLSVITDIKIVQVEKFNDAGLKLVQKKPSYGPRETVRHRIDLYDKNGDLINWKDLSKEERFKLWDKLDYKPSDPKGVLSPDPAAGKGSLRWGDNGLYLETTTALNPQQPGNAMIEITATNPDGKIVKAQKQLPVSPGPSASLVKQVSAGGVQPTPITPTAVTPTEVTPTAVTPTPINPTPIIIGAVAAAGGVALLAAAAAGAAGAGGSGYHCSESKPAWCPTAGVCCPSYNIQGLYGAYYFDGWGCTGLNGAVSRATRTGQIPHGCADEYRNPGASFSL